VVELAGEGAVAGVIAGFADVEAALDFGEPGRTGFGYGGGVRWGGRGAGSVGAGGDADTKVAAADRHDLRVMSALKPISRKLVFAASYRIDNVLGTLCLIVMMLMTHSLDTSVVAN